MCGITGFVDFKKEKESSLLSVMSSALRHRGPDDSGTYFDANGYANVGFGHRRLSIQDLSTKGHQPMSYLHLTIVFNGEIYNFKEIKKDLEKTGHHFDSDSDTEVILKAYSQWGMECLTRFIGMFAFSIYDKKQDQVIVVRDRAGVKPLYYFWDNHLFLLASELKAFYALDDYKKEIDFKSLAMYFQYGYIPSPHSIMRDTFKLEPGHYLVLDLKNKKLAKTCYWSVSEKYNESKLILSEKEILMETEKLLNSSFSYRMVSDVPVGVFLSGGYDSSLVAAVLQKNSISKIKTFTIGFEDQNYNEAPFARKVAQILGTDHSELMCHAKEAKEIISLLPEIYDEPFGDSSAIPTYLVSKFASEQVKVALSADGGDEIFGGYPVYQQTLKIRSLFKLAPLSLRKIFKSQLKKININELFSEAIYNFEGKWAKLLAFLDCESIDSFYDINTAYFLDPLIKEIFIEPTLPYQLSDMNIRKPNHLVQSLLAKSYRYYLSDNILVKVDRATMKASLEGREPFMDHRLIEFLARVPVSLKLKNSKEKYLIKQITHQYLPEGLMNRPKQGFSIPIYGWLKNDLKFYLHQYLEGDFVKAQKIFSPSKLSYLVEQFLEGKGNPHQLWLLLNFQLWYERWMK